MNTKRCYTFQVQLLWNYEKYLSQNYHIIASCYNEAQDKLNSIFENQNNVKYVDSTFIDDYDIWE